MTARFDRNSSAEIWTHLEALSREGLRHFATTAELDSEFTGPTPGMMCTVGSGANFVEYRYTGVAGVWIAWNTEWVRTPFTGPGIITSEVFARWDSGCIHFAGYITVSAPLTAGLILSGWAGELGAFKPASPRFITARGPGAQVANLILDPATNIRVEGVVGAAADGFVSFDGCGLLRP